MSILVVDDSNQYRILMVHMLGREEFGEVLPVASAQEGFEILGLDGEPRNNVELIFMDLVMPVMDGIEALTVLKGDGRLRDIPVIVLTGVSDDELLEQAFMAGAADYIVKPVKKVELLARTRSLLRLKKETDMRKARERELEETVARLEKALAEVKQLSGLLPICANCKKIRDDEGYWQQVEVYISDHTPAQFSHGVCPDCIRKLYPQLADKILKNK